MHTLVAMPETGRRYRSDRTVRLGDVTPSGRLRLDAVARYLQDIANDDSTDAGLADNLAWVVRRLIIEVETPAFFGEGLEIETACTGVGASCAERRTTIVGARGARIDASAIWVSVDQHTGRPRRLGEDFDHVYGLAARGRRVRPRLDHVRAPTSNVAPPLGSRRWILRSTDFDLFGHVNNAVYVGLAEELFAAGFAAPRPLRVEVEFRRPVERSQYGIPTDATCVGLGPEARAAPVLVDRIDGAVCQRWVLIDDGRHEAASLLLRTG